MASAGCTPYDVALDAAAPLGLTVRADQETRAFEERIDGVLIVEVVSEDNDRSAALFEEGDDCSLDQVSAIRGTILHSPVVR